MTDSCISSNEYPIVVPSLQSNSSENALRCVSSPRSMSSLTFSRSSFDKSNTFDYEKAKAFLQQPSSKSGDNLFDHLVELLNRIIDERPRNVIDFFENYSRVLRSKFGALKWSVIEEPQFLDLAKSLMKFLKPPDESIYVENVEEYEDLKDSEMSILQSFDSLETNVERSLSENENVIQILHIWSFCGISFHIDEVFRLSMAVQKVQLHDYVENVRFWGRIFGLKGSYYVVEAILTATEVEKRLNKMKNTMLIEMQKFLNQKDKHELVNAADLNLIPGVSWTESPHPSRMNNNNVVPPVPQLEGELKFPSPPEPVGFGLNRRTYFVTTNLSEDWQELPLVTPEHIKASRMIKKFFTGDLEASLDSYPLFPGSEKHFLRAVISRITSGTYIAPLGFYRKMTKQESQQVDNNEEADEEDLESEDESGFTNDILITQNENFEQLSLDETALPSNWVHIRPNILNQGRVVYVNEEHFIKDLEKKALLSMNGTAFDAADENYFENEDIEEEELLTQKEEMTPLEIGPQLFSSCDGDKNTENIPSWTARHSSLFNKANQMTLMRSNLWPGAYSLLFDNFCDSIYFGWGFKYVPRSMSIKKAPILQDIENKVLDCETTDPTVEMEEKWHQYHAEKNIIDYEDDGDMSVEVDFDDEDD